MYIYSEMKEYFVAFADLKGEIDLHRLYDVAELKVAYIGAPRGPNTAPFRFRECQNKKGYKKSVRGGE